MPYASYAQRRKFHVLEKQGKISHATVAEFDSASKGMNLPEKVGERRKAAKPIAEAMARRKMRA